MNKIRTFLLFCLIGLLSGCKMAVLDPKGVIAASEKSLLVDATLLMLLVVIPVIFLTLLFVWKYRAKNSNAKYTPNWAHSTALEVVWWSIPCVIIGILAVITWISSHQLDPYRPLDTKAKPITIQAVALDWKWLFIYPKQHIASVNFIQIPVNTPVTFLVTADAPMNSLEIPQLAGQIYAMTGMQSKLHLMATASGTYRGLSTNFSGNGFSDMHFLVKVSSKKKFLKWIKTQQRGSNQLTIAAYKNLAKPSEDNPVITYSYVAPNLFKKVINKYMMPNRQNMGQVTAANK